MLEMSTDPNFGAHFNYPFQTSIPVRTLFFFILLLPCAAQTYVCWRTWQLLPFPLWGKLAMMSMMIIAFGFFFLALMPVSDKLPLTLGSAVYNIGNSWAVIMLYLFMMWVAFDFLRLCRIVPSRWFHDNGVTALLVCIVFCVLFGCAYAHYNHTQRVSLTFKVGKYINHMRIVINSDWHLDYHNRRAELARWLALISDEHPDVILIAGDIIDHHYRPLIEERMAEEFRRLKAPVYACLGNHEYFAGRRTAELFYRESGINLLRDSVVEFRGLSIIGRDDRMNTHRRTLADLMTSVRPESFIILLDHQPYNLEEAEVAGVDFEFAGHTHHGQIWPGNWITEAIYECAFGFYQRGDTRYYVSSGLGIWGARFRIGTQSEYVVAELCQ